MALKMIPTPTSGKQVSPPRSKDTRTHGRATTATTVTKTPIMNLNAGSSTLSSPLNGGVTHNYRQKHCHGTRSHRRPLAQSTAALKSPKTRSPAGRMASYHRRTGSNHRAGRIQNHSEPYSRKRRPRGWRISSMCRPKDWW
jgi:hypothetical protein